MNKDEILKKVNDIFIDILDNEGLVLTYETTANEVDDWDSLNNIQLMVAVEKQFKLRFTLQEVESWENVGEMINSINSKLK